MALLVGCHELNELGSKVKENFPLQDSCFCVFLFPWNGKLDMGNPHSSYDSSFFTHILCEGNAGWRMSVQLDCDVPHVQMTDQALKY